MTQTETVLVSMAASSALAGTVAFLARTWISERLKAAIGHEYQSKLEGIKAVLKSEHDVQLEKLKAALVLETQIATKQFDYQRRETLKSVEEIYSALVECEVKAADYASPWGEVRGEKREADRKEAVLKMREFEKVLSRRRLYLPESIADDLVGLKKKLHGLIVDYMVGIEQGQGSGNAENWKKVMEALDTSIPKAKRDLETRFRELLETK